MPELPTTARGTATSRRILDAATAEFAERGIAGARIDRIIAAARTNKAQLYGYYGNKDSLFDAVIADRAGRLLTAVPLDATDLPGWAVGLYDETLRHPELVRLMTWLRLERRHTARLSDTDDGPKLAAIAAAQAAGQIRDGDPFDLLVLVIGMALAWSPASGAWAASADEPAADHERRRALLRDSVRRTLAP
ncbi:TetR family transcriptional regulator [Actinocatenispora thailandica]|uniref:TetR family transcriptional regulator n=1 Tax=Actinocatenispora thailandica TaxID=227318 RepID=A0A7R7DT03_9ACTN|nr:TetR family transcriptional regulator [Actinocatenispora thailandica]BCJ37007.1 TetR family transcriptional regulator [Actinocatenispora thailandica]